MIQYIGDNIRQVLETIEHSHNLETRLFIADFENDFDKVRLEFIYTAPKSKGNT